MKAWFLVLILTTGTTDTDVEQHVVIEMPNYNACLLMLNHFVYTETVVSDDVRVVRTVKSKKCESADV